MSLDPQVSQSESPLNDTSRFLNPRERALLQAVVDTYYPEVLPQPGDDPIHFRANARQWPLVELIATAFWQESTEAAQQLKHCLRALSRPWQAWWQYPRWRRFEHLPLGEKAEWLVRFESRVPTAWRLTLQSIRKLIWETVYGPEQGAARPSVIARVRHANSNVVTGGPAEWWENWQATRSDATDRATRNAGLQASPLRPGQETVACDFLVIGSGAAGAVMAAELAETGRRVLLVERAALVEREQFLWPPAPTLIETWGRVATPALPVAIQTASAWGGSTLAAETGFLDPPADLLRQWAQQWGLKELLSEDFRHSLYTVRRRLDLTEKDDDDDPTTRTWLEDTARGLGYGVRRAHSSCVLANAACELCTRGCPSGDWADARNTYLMDAQRLGVYLLPGCEVRELEFEDERAVGARAWLTETDGQQRELAIKFRTVVLCAGAIHTPRILQRSGYVATPVGQRLRLHPSIWVAAEMPEANRDIALDRMLVSTAAGLDSLAEYCELRPVPTNPLRASLAVPFRSDSDHKRWLQRWERLVLIQVTLRDSGLGFVTGPPRRDGVAGGSSSNGSVDPGRYPAMARDIEIRYRLSDLDRARLIAGAEAAVRWLRQAGCPVVFSPWDPQWRMLAELDDPMFERVLGRSRRMAQRGQLPAMWSAAATSTCRMSDSPIRGVVDGSGQLFGASNVFITDASILPTATSSDPRLLVTTLSHFLAQGIKQRIEG